MFLLREKNIYATFHCWFVFQYELNWTDMYNGEDKSGDSLYIIVNK